MRRLLLTASLLVIASAPSVQAADHASDQQVSEATQAQDHPTTDDSVEAPAGPYPRKSDSLPAGVRPLILIKQDNLAEVDRSLSPGGMPWYDGAYAELRAGANFLQDADNDGGSLNGSEVDFDTGFAASGAIGYAFSNRNIFGYGFWNNLRAEFEGFFNYNEIDDVSAAPALFRDRDAEVTASGGMFNLYYDFDGGSVLGPRFANWKPYIGAGVGGAVIDVDDADLRDDADVVLAYQARAGVGYEFTPSVTLSVGYRFFDTADPEFTAADGSRFDSEYRSHTVEVGVRYSF